jgi:HEAT repeat protein
VEALQRVGLRAIPMFVGPDAKAAVPALRDALGDSRPLVRMLADEALRRIDADD